MKTRKNDHPGYSFERAQWALVTGVGPLNLLFWQPPASTTIIAYRSRYVNPCLRGQFQLMRRPFKNENLGRKPMFTMLFLIDG
jgi:hypothetical protein